MLLLPSCSALPDRTDPIAVVRAAQRPRLRSLVWNGSPSAFFGWLPVSCTKGPCGRDGP